MDPKKQRLVLAIVGVLAALVWVRVFLIKPSRRIPATAPPIPVAPQAPPGAPQSPVLAPSTDWGENPFLIDRRAAKVPASGSMGTAAPKAHLLSGILWDPKVPSAIVDSQLVGIGDRVGPWQVTDIQKDKVILSDGAQTQTLTVQ